MAAIAIPNFVQARAAAQMNACISNLWQIEAAKQRWAAANNKAPTDTPTAQDLSSYLPGGFSALKCPAGGVYHINAVGENPTCSIPRHELPEAATPEQQ